MQSCPCPPARRAGGPQHSAELSASCQPTGIGRALACRAMLASKLPMQAIPRRPKFDLHTWMREAASWVMGVLPAPPPLAPPEPLLFPPPPLDAPPARTDRRRGRAGRLSLAALAIEDCSSAERGALGRHSPPLEPPLATQTSGPRPATAMASIVFVCGERYESEAQARSIKSRPHSHPDQHAQRALSSPCLASGLAFHHQ